ncbi:MAG: ABC transporter ATP-binding protein [Lachnospiraceae bacterium]|nr:ABC transporter ATP-binding protein [Lachnospiraceae bacterium]
MSEREQIELKQIIINNIYKAYGKKVVLNNVSFSVNSGECIGIIGVNGSGKTTLFNVITGEANGFTGDVILKTSNDTADNNSYLHKNKKLLKKTIGYIPQENPLIDDLSAYDNLRLWYCDSTLDLEKELSEGVLNTLGISDFRKVKVKHLSGGMKKRLSIGISLASEPDFLILDEPGAALDLIAKDIIKNYLLSYKSNKGGIIIATHDEEELSLCDRVLVLKNGTLNEISPTMRGSDLVNKLL